MGIHKIVAHQSSDNIGIAWGRWFAVLNSRYRLLGLANSLRTGKIVAKFGDESLESLAHQDWLRDICLVDSKVATLGEDKTIKVWSLDPFKLESSRFVAYSLLVGG